MKSVSIFCLAIVFLLLVLPGATPGSVGLTVELDKPVVYCRSRETVILKILFEADKVPDCVRRLPLNVSLILDKSGSMSGRKIEDAKEAALEVVRRLRPNDTFSLVVFDDEPRILIPAGPLGNGKKAIRAINCIYADGSTALYGGLTFGAAELRKSECDRTAPRIIILSDGIANVGPSSTSDLAALGRSLAREGITVTTVGLGLDYNEDLMTALAANGGGNNYFARNSCELVRIFAEEIGDAAALAARDLTVRVIFPEGVVPRAVLGRAGRISGRIAEIELKNLYSTGSKYVLVEAEVPEAAAGTVMPLAEIRLSYDDILTAQKASSARSVSISYTGNPDEVERNLNREVVKATTLTRVAIEKEKAIELADQGDYAGAARVMAANQVELKEAAAVCGDDEEMKNEAENCERFSSSISADKGLSKYSRKRIMNEIYIQENQQRYESR